MKPERTITIYCRYTLDGMVKPMRRVLKFCSWEDLTIDVALQTGNVLKEPFSIRIECERSGLTYIEPHEWKKLLEEELEEYWTVDLTLPAQPLIVPFECDYEFEWGTEAQISTAENDFIRDTPGARRIAQEKDNRWYNEDNEPICDSHVRLQA